MIDDLSRYHNVCNKLTTCFLYGEFECSDDSTNKDSQMDSVPAYPQFTATNSEAGYRIGCVCVCVCVCVLHINIRHFFYSEISQSSYLCILTAFIIKTLT